MPNSVNQDDEAACGLSHQLSSSDAMPCHPHIQQTHNRPQYYYIQLSPQELSAPEEPLSVFRHQDTSASFLYSPSTDLRRDQPRASLPNVYRPPSRLQSFVCATSSWIVKYRSNCKWVLTWPVLGPLPPFLCAGGPSLHKARVLYEGGDIVVDEIT